MIANKTEIQVAPSGNQAGIQIEKREMIASAIKQYAAENAIAPMIRLMRENLLIAPLNAAARTTIAHSKIHLTRRSSRALTARNGKCWSPQPSMPPPITATTWPANQFGPSFWQWDWPAR